MQQIFLNVRFRSTMWQFCGTITLFVSLFPNDTRCGMLLILDLFRVSFLAGTMTQSSGIQRRRTAGRLLGRCPPAGAGWAACPCSWGRTPAAEAVLAPPPRQRSRRWTKGPESVVVRREEANFASTLLAEERDDDTLSLTEWQLKIGVAVRRTHSCVLYGQLLKQAQTNPSAKVLRTHAFSGGSIPLSKGGSLGYTPVSAYSVFFPVIVICHPILLWSITCDVNMVP